MNWITTNISLPEDLYIDLKLKAARDRKSVAAVIRERIVNADTYRVTKHKKRVSTLLRELEKLAEVNARENKGINFTKEIIKMRYEQ